MELKNNTKRLMTFLLLFAMIFNLIINDGTTFAQGTEVNRTDVKITKFEIKDQDGNTIPPGQQHGYWNKYRLEMEWDASIYGKTLQAGDYFIINLPKQFKFPTEPASVVDFPLYAPDGHTVIANAHVNSYGGNGGGTVKVTFTDYVVNRENIKGNLFLEATFAHKNIKPGEVNTIVVEIGGVPVSVDINIGNKPGLNQEIFTKWGEKVYGDENKAKWSLRINHKQGHFNNVVIKDELFVSSGALPPDIHYLRESFVLNEVQMDEYGAVQKVLKTYKYEQLKNHIKFLDNDTKFEFDFSGLLGNTSGKQFTMNYISTYIPQLRLKNKGVFVSNEENGSSSSYFLSAQVGGGGQGDLNQKIKIIKIDEEDNQKKLANAKFLITKVSDGSTFELTTDVNGEAISQKLDPGKYKIKETSAPLGYILDGKEYDLTIIGGEALFYTVKNKRSKVTISVEKAWQDANNQDGVRPDSITVKLLADDQETGKELVLKASEGWKGSFKNLDEYKDGKKINYTIKELPVGNNYISVISGSAANGFKVTNSREPEKVNISGEKTWDDNNNQDGKRPEQITVKLMKKVGEAAPVVAQTKEVKEGTDKKWKYEFNNLPKYENGQEITYTIDEEDVTGYTKTIEGKNIKNSHTPETVDISGEKTWDDNNNQDGKRPTTIKVKLLKKVGEAAPVVAQTKEVKEGIDKKWKYEFNNLPKYENGQEITYTIDEEDVTGYTKTIEGKNIKNSHTPETVDISGEKTWNDNNNQDGKRPEQITVKLMKKVGEAAPVVAQTKEVKEGADKKWKYEFNNLPKYENGKEIIYTIDEETVAGYTIGIAGYNLTNTYIPETVDVSGTKTWDDANNQDGKRPEKIKVILNKTVDGQISKVTEKEITKSDWTYEFKGLPKYENGKLIAYSIDEEKVEGYEKTIDGYNLTNKYTPGKTSVQVTKAWEDKNNQDGVRPESVTVRLLADGVETDKTLTLTKVNNWTGSFTELDEYKAGNKIVYTVKEEAVENGYTSVVTGSAENGFTVTNIREPEKTFVEGTKTWEDAENQDGKRPEQIKINLLKNGAVLETKIVTEADAWKWKFENLDKYENGEIINYTITEEKVEGYTTEVTGYNVKNSYTPGKTSVQVTKAWEDKN
ncbi:MAG: Cna B-type domain-containing protein, partial [Tissierellia bacterium]|nr:Cna B-type domain-containing protein [Tissierellia bacterium]